MSSEVLGGRNDVMKCKKNECTGGTTVDEYGADCTSRQLLGF